MAPALALSSPLLMGRVQSDAMPRLLARFHFIDQPIMGGHGLQLWKLGWTQAWEGSTKLVNIDEENTYGSSLSSLGACFWWTNHKAGDGGFSVLIKMEIVSSNIVEFYELLHQLEQSGKGRR